MATVTAADLVNMTCPACKHFNALLHTGRTPAGLHLYRCRDCGEACQYQAPAEPPAPTIKAAAVLDAAETLRREGFALLSHAVADHRAGRIADAVDGWRRASEKYRAACGLFDALHGCSGSAALCRALAEVAALAAARVSARQEGGQP